ncbi:MAG TPA: ThiF family adenylyltransferase [Gemmataceae bacterium]|nr:ThiF family adenylyltransferase [Gemmataceae bacterium]
MSVTGDIANRHMLPASGLADASKSDMVSVRVVVDDVWARSISGQLLASCLINLLCRQVGLISRIEIVAAPAPTLISLPGVAEPEPFPACLARLARWAVQDRITIAIGATDAEFDYKVVVGGAGADHSAARHELVAIGDGWRAWLGEPLRAPKHVSAGSKNPLGPFFAATLAAGEIFKRSRGILRGRYLVAAGYSLWSGLSSDEWERLENGPELAGLSLPPTHIAGGGAVGNGLAYIIAYAQFADAYVIPIDDDSYDDTNLNRCVLAGWDDQEDNKVDAIARMLHATNVAVFPFAGSIKEYVTDPKNGLRSDIAAKVNQLEFDIVVSCVDKGTSRQDIQGLWPNLLLGGSTLDLQAKANLYGAWPGAACLGACAGNDEHGCFRCGWPEKDHGFTLSSLRA